MSILQRISKEVRYFLISFILFLLVYGTILIINQSFLLGGSIMAFALFISVLANWGRGEEIQAAFDALDCVDAVDCLCDFGDFGFCFFE